MRYAPLSIAWPTQQLADTNCFMRSKSAVEYCTLLLRAFTRFQVLLVSLCASPSCSQALRIFFLFLFIFVVSFLFWYVYIPLSLSLFLSLYLSVFFIWLISVHICVNLYQPYFSHSAIVTFLSVSQCSHTHIHSNSSSLSWFVLQIICTI